MRGRRTGSIVVVRPNCVQASDNAELKWAGQGTRTVRFNDGLRRTGGARAGLVSVITGSPRIKVLAHVSHSSAVCHQYQSVACLEDRVGTQGERALAAEDRDNVCAVAIEARSAGGYAGMHAGAVGAEYPHEQAPAAGDVHPRAGPEERNQIELVELVGVVRLPSA